MGTEQKTKPRAKTQNWVKHWVWHTDPWPRAKSLTWWPSSTVHLCA